MGILDILQITMNSLHFLAASDNISFSRFDAKGKLLCANKVPWKEKFRVIQQDTDI